jgi:hypothetical protein
MMKSTILCLSIDSVWKLVIRKDISYPLNTIRLERSVLLSAIVSYLDGFAAEDNEVLRALHHEAGELVAQDALNLICLLDFDAKTDGVDGGLYEDAFVLVTRNSHRVQENLERAAIVALAVKVKRA